MTDPLGIAVTAWTARCAVVCYLLRLGTDLAVPESPVWQRRGRLVWTVGLLVFVCHVAAALHFYHQWDQAAAWEHTRQETLRQTGWDSGAGLIVNYAFLVLWMIDAAAWWIDERWPQRRAVYATLQSIYGFLIFQATVVFGPPGWIPAAILAGIGLAAASGYRFRAKIPHQS